jgi:hypothetical protein
LRRRRLKDVRLAADAAREMTCKEGDRHRDDHDLGHERGDACEQDGRRGRALSLLGNRLEVSGLVAEGSGRLAAASCARVRV